MTRRANQKPATPPAGPPISASSIRAGYTGRYLILIDPRGHDEAKKALASAAGIKVTSVQGDDSVAALHDMGAGEGLMFDDLGVAVVETPPDQGARVGVAVSGSEALIGIEQERYVYAATSVDASYLLGYRDAVNSLVETVLGRPGGTGPVRQTGLASFADETSLSWGLQALGVAMSRQTGKGVRVAVLDTGLDLLHPDFAGRVSEDTQTKSFVPNVSSVQDGHGHGTHCAGIACGTARPTRLPRFGVAPDADLFVGKVLDDSGTGTDSSILAGIQWAISSKCDIVSMSLGAPVEEGAAYSAIFEQAARRAGALGCLIFAAAGNDSRRPQLVRPVSHPANCPSIVAVAALDQNLAVACFSNAGLNPDGGQVDIAAPGVDCISAWPTPTMYKSESGTSMATPHVAGLAALYAEANAGVRGPQLLPLLFQNARRLPAASADVGSGLAQAP